MEDARSVQYHMILEIQLLIGIFYIMEKYMLSNMKFMTRMVNN